MSKNSMHSTIEVLNGWIGQLKGYKGGSKVKGKTEKDKKKTNK